MRGIEQVIYDFFALDDELVWIGQLHLVAPPAIWISSGIGP
jgi:hypothetical protein